MVGELAMGHPAWCSLETMLIYWTIGVSQQYGTFLLFLTLTGWGIGTAHAGSGR